MTYARTQVYFYSILFLLSLGMTFVIFRPYLGALVLAVTFAVIFYPLYEKLFKFINKRVKWKKGAVAKILTSLFITFLLIAIIITPLYFLGTRLALEIKGVYSSLADNTDWHVLNNIFVYLENSFGLTIPSLTESLSSYLREGAGLVAENIGSIFSSLGKLFVFIFLTLLAFYYFLKDGGEFKKFFIKMSPLPDADDDKILKKLQSAINSVIRGSLVVAVVQGILTGLGFYIFGIPNATLWGSFAAIAALLPTLGTSLVIIPGVLFLFFTENFYAAVGLLIWGIVAVGLIDNFLGPQLMKRGVAIHPFLILLAVLGGISFFGPLGFIFGPLVLSLLFALFDIYKEIFLPNITAKK